MKLSTDQGPHSSCQAEPVPRLHLKCLGYTVGKTQPNIRSPGSSKPDEVELFRVVRAMCAPSDRSHHTNARGMRATCGSILATSSNLGNRFEAFLCLEKIIFEQNKKPPWWAPTKWHMSQRCCSHHYD